MDFPQKIGAGSTFPPRNLNFCGSEGSDDELLQVLRQVSRIGRNRDDDLDVGGDLVDGVQDLGSSGHIVVGDAQDAVEEQLGNIVVACQHACHKAVQHISTGNAVLVNVYQTGGVVDLGGELHALFNDNNVAGGGLDGLVDHIDHGLGLTGAFGSNNQFQHRGLPPYIRQRAVRVVPLLFQRGLQLSLAVLIAGLAQQREHILLVALNTGLVERIYTEQIA